jgi:hypothetical protein
MPSSSGSTPSLSPLDSEDEDSLSSIESAEISPLSPRPVIQKASTNAKEGQMYVHRRIYEELVRRQYWRDGWRLTTRLSLQRPFDIGDASTLGMVCLADFALV